MMTTGVLISCDEDDICVNGEGTPNLTVVFRNNLDSENRMDTLTIYAASTPDFENRDTLYQKFFTDSIKLPLGGLGTSNKYFSIQRRSNEIVDILTVSYDNKSEYVSKACGFRLTYDNLNYNITQNFMEYLIPEESKELKDEKITNLRIALSD